MYDFDAYTDALNTRGQRSESMDELPEGTYQCRVLRAVLKEGKDTGNPYFEWELGILAGQHSGLKIWKRAMLQTGQNWQYFGWDCDCLGVPIQHPNDVNLDTWRVKHINAAVEVKVRYRVDRNGQRQQNAYFQKPLSVASVATTTPSRPATSPPTRKIESNIEGGGGDLPF